MWSSSCILIMGVCLLAGCGQYRTKLDYKTDVGDGGRQDVSANQAVAKSDSLMPLTLDNGNAQAVFGGSGSGLTGTCADDGAKAVKLSGDVVDGQIAQCVRGKFAFSSFSLSEGEGLKNLFVEQMVVDGSLQRSTAVQVRRDDSTVFKFPENFLSAEPTRGLRGAEIGEVGLAGELLFISFVRGGAAISRDKGKSWYSKTSANGLGGSSLQQFSYINGQYLATSSRELLSSIDGGRSWAKADPNVTATYVFKDLRVRGGNRSYVSEDSGKTWTAIEPVLYYNGPANYFSLFDRLYTKSRSGVYVYEHANRRWQPATLQGLPDGWIVQSLEGDESTQVAEVCVNPQSSGSECRFMVSSNAMKSWSQVYSTTLKTYTRLEVSKVGQVLIRSQKPYSSFKNDWVHPKADAVSISRDASSYWAPLSLPPEFSGPEVSAKTDVSFDQNMLLIRHRDKFAIAVDPKLVSWRSFRLPSGLTDSKLIRLRVLGEQVFLVFQNGLLFADKDLKNWRQLFAEPQPQGFRGLFSAHGLIYGWNDASVLGPGGLYVSADGGISFKNISSRLNLLDGFYDDSKVKEVQAGIVSAGYSMPVRDMVQAGQKIFVATPEGVAVSSDVGQSFSFLEGQDGRARPVAVSLAALDNKIALATSESGLLLSSDAGQTWKPITTATGLPTNRLKAVTISAEALIVQANSNAVFISNDEGVTWRELSFSSAAPGETFFGLKLSRGVVLYQSYVWSKSVRGFEGMNVRVVNTRVTRDLGKSFQDVKIDNGDPAGLSEYRFSSFVAHETGLILGGNNMAFILKEGSSVWQKHIVEDATGVLTLGSSVYFGNRNGLYVKSPLLAASLDEVPGTSQLSAPQALAECLPLCAQSENDETAAGTSDSSEKSSPKSSPKLSVSDCDFNKQMGKCEVDVEWSGAPAHACLWISEAGMPAVASDCAPTDSPTAARIHLDHLKAGQDYSFFLAHEVSKGKPGEVFAQVSVLGAQLSVSKCIDRFAYTCSAEIRWQNATPNSCVWTDNPKTKKPLLVGCAVESPISHRMQTQLVYGQTRFFLARQSADPGVPLNENFREVRVSEPEPENFPGYEQLLSPPLFDAKFYLKFYKDIADAFGPENVDSAAIHWLMYGHQEGRMGVAGLIGHIDGIWGGQVHGWTCKNLSEKSVAVKIFVEDPNSKERFFVASGPADLTAEEGIHKACGVQGNFRYSIKLAQDIFETYPGYKVYAYGVDSLDNESKMYPLINGNNTEIPKK